MAAISTVAKSGNTDIDGVLSGYRWASGALTYSFTTSSAQYGYAVPGFEAFNADQKAATLSVLANYAGVANLTFTEVTNGTGTLRFAESNDPGTAYAYYPHTSEYGGDAFFNHRDYNSAPKGTYAYATFLHEIGHALGLDHGQDGLGALPTNHDSLEYSVMTYRSFVGADLNGYTAYQGSYPTTLMMADIAALQYMYGANFTANAGDSTYKWNPTTGEMTLNGVSSIKSVTNTVFMTIWDGGGNDTYDFSSYTTNLSINLTPGEWTTSSTAQLANLGLGHYARGNVANAMLYQGNLASLIENATGGSGNDLIVGNVGRNYLRGGNGNDSLKGLAGNDTIDGGAGTDTCYFAIASTACTVTYDATAQRFLIVSTAEGTDTLYGVEFFAFTDKTINASIISSGAPTLVSSSPADGAVGVRDDANIVLTFSENVFAGTGKITIRAANGTIFQTFDMATVSPDLTISGKTVTINPTGYLKAGTGYYITIDAGAIKDNENKTFAGITNTTDLNFTVETTVYRGTTLADALSGTAAADRMYGSTGNDTLTGNAGNDLLDGEAGVDSMIGGLGNDIYYVDSFGEKIVELAGQGTDLVYSSVGLTLGENVEKLTLIGAGAIDGAGNALANTLIGNSYANRLYGRAGNDTVNGASGDDQIYGEDGMDVLTGGVGKDNFVFGTALSATNIDTITDFSVVDDTIVLQRTIFSALPAGALSSGNFAKLTDANVASARIVYDSATGSLFYDADGAGSAPDVKFAVLTPGLALTAADFLIA